MYVYIATVGSCGLRENLTFLTFLCKKEEQREVPLICTIIGGKMDGQHQI